MALGPNGGDHDLVLSPSWPAPVAAPRRLTTPEVRRRVDAAQRRGLRQAVTIGGALIAAVVAIDMGRSYLTLGDVGAWMAIVQAVGLAVIGLLVLGAVRRSVRVELLAMGLALVVLTLTLVRLLVLPDSPMISVAYLSIVIVGSGLFLPWSRRWHAAWLITGFAMTVVAVVIWPEIARASDGFGTLQLIVASAAAASYVGHRLWQARLLHMLEQQFALRQLSRYAKRQELRVTELNRELNRLVRRDALTGVGNRLALDEALARMLDQADRTRPTRFAVALFDIDHFKRYNDEHGHLAGDAALGHLGHILRRITRWDDLAFRYGGEEFVVLLPGVSLADALATAERVRHAVEETRSGHLPAFTISGGVAVCDPADGRDPGPVLRRADTALYVAKRAGRNRIEADDLSIAIERQVLMPAG